MWIIMMIEPFSRKLLATAFIACREKKSHFSLTVADVAFHLHFRTLLHFFYCTCNIWQSDEQLDMGLIQMN